MFAALLKALGAGLSLWESKEKRKYVDKLMELKRAYYEEYNKNPEERSDAVLDNIRSELRILSDAFCSSVGVSDSSPKP